ncbi:transposase [Clostridiaceae bacterium 35-E11]
MPRAARKKNPETTHHIMCRSISEVPLFRNDQDKVKYLKLLSIYCEKFKSQVLAYCLMDTHLHIQLDPLGCDISKFMHGLNLCYAQYYNRKYKRHGHLFQGRFASKVIDKDNYNLTVSAYIHNNPKDLPKFKDAVHTYYFSSYGIYLGYYDDDFGLIDQSFILSYFSKNRKTARMKYAEFVTNYNKVNQKEDLQELINTLTKSYEYRSDRFHLARDNSPEEVVSTVSQLLHIDTPHLVKIKYNHHVSDFRAISAFFLRCLCDYTYKDICKVIGNVCISEVAKLCQRGYQLLKNDSRYQHLLSTVLRSMRAA